MIPCMYNEFKQELYKPPQTTFICVWEVLCVFAVKMLFEITLAGCKEWPVRIKKNSTAFLYSCRESCKELSLLVSTR